MTKPEVLQFIERMLADYYPDDTEYLACSTNFKRDGFLRFDIHDIVQDSHLPRIISDYPQQPTPTHK